MDIVNRFGHGTLYSMDELISEQSEISIPMIYATSTACMSVTSDLMSWASEKHSNIVFVDKNGEKYNNIIIVLGCQVTDLAILNDIKTAERLHDENPKATIYMGGCLAYRFDIELPKYIRRLAATRIEYNPIDMESNSIQWEKPFWVKNWEESDEEFSDGHLFRDMYPLKIGAGCSGKCKYCTIRDTRGQGYEADAFLQVKEFLDHNDVVLVSDSPTVQQIKDWAIIAHRYNKQFSLRNVEPSVVCACKDELMELAEHRLLKILHSPIQSNNEELLKIMNRSVKLTFDAIDILKSLRKLGVKIATNIIIDYTYDGKKYKNMDVNWLNDTFDYWSWNPYFDGNWSRDKAEERFDEYINNRSGHEPEGT